MELGGGNSFGGSFSSSPRTARLNSRPPVPSERIACPNRRVPKSITITTTTTTSSHGLSIAPKGYYRAAGR